MTSPTFSAGSQSPPQTIRARQLSPADRLRQLDELKTAVHADFARLDRSLAEEQILLSQYREYLKQTYAGRNESEVLAEIRREQQKINNEIYRAKHPPQRGSMIVGLFLLFIFAGLGGILLFGTSDTSLTGYVSAPIEPITLDVSEGFTANTNISLNVTDIIGVVATGELTGGSGELYLWVGEERYVVWSGATSEEVYTITTDKTSYALNSTINVTVQPDGIEYTLWLTNEEGEKTLVQESFITEVSGAFTLDALINDSGNISKITTSFTVRNDTNSSSDIVREPELISIMFEEACVETCELESTTDSSLMLEIRMSEDAEFIISELLMNKPRENNPPEQLVDIENIQLTKGESITLDLNSYFTDLDEDTLTFDYMAAPGVDITIENNELILTGVSAGESESIIYVSDLYDLIPSNSFTITVQVTENETQPGNTTINETEPEEVIGETPVVVDTQSIETKEFELNCTNSDPNLRPIGCLELEGAKYFQDQTIFISDGSRKPLARLTPIGNLLLTGIVEQNAEFSGDTSDYVIGYEDDYGRFITTVWFSKDGNLYLKGQLFEENANAVPPPGSFALRNRKGVTLAWAMQHSGDLYVRGNVIPYRTSITE